MNVTLYSPVPADHRPRWEQFIAVVEAFRERCGLPELDLAGGAPFVVDGVTMSFRFDPSVMPNHLTVWVDFGPSPVAPAQLRSLLERNFSDGPQGSLYAINPQTGHVVCAASMELSRCEPQVVDAVLRQLAESSKTSGGR